jgi:TonB family protein
VRVAGFVEPTLPAQAPAAPPEEPAHHAAPAPAPAPVPAKAPAPAPKAAAVAVKQPAAAPKTPAPAPKAPAPAPQIVPAAATPPPAQPQVAQPVAPAPPPEPVIPMLSNATISAIASDNARQLAKCEGTYELHGDVSVTFQIDANGKVVKSQLSSSIKHPQVAGCILKAVQSWKFPKPPSGSAKGVYSINYQ